MARATITVRATELATVRLLYVELQMLLDEMRVGASPFAEHLESILDRFDARHETPDPESDDDAVRE